MVKAPLYHQTVAILYNAYINNTLENGNLYAGAVGNLVAVALGYEYKRGTAPGFETDNENLIYLVWVKNGVVMPYPNYVYDRDIVNGWHAPIIVIGENRFIEKEYLKGPALEQINATGYNIKELSQIDKAFQSHNFGPVEDSIYYGLIKVLEALHKIHYVIDEKLMEQNILRFKTHYQSLLVAQK